MRAREFLTEDDHVYHGTAESLVPFVQHGGLDPEASSDGLVWFAKDPEDARRYSEAHKHQFAGPKRRGAVLRIHKKDLPMDALSHLTYSDVTATAQHIPPDNIEVQQPDGTWRRLALAESHEVLTPQHIHDLADRLGIPWDDDPGFLEMTKRVTGKAHLDDLDQTGLQKIQDHLLGINH